MNRDLKQMRSILLLLAAVIAILAILWFALLRTTYVPVYQNIREAEASAIVGELDNAGIPYRITNNGHDIEVPEEQAAEARVVIAGSDASLGGTVGFELFNDSDMGLTEFAQKINFQRAMQGELARTIMMMDGVAFARVHLAIPERSIFRTAQGTPTAAVTVEMKPGRPLTQQRIGGIRQLVASSVPTLTPFDVAILDEQGDLVSASTAVGESALTTPQNEQAALEEFFAAKARGAISDVLPGLRFNVSVTVRPRSDAPDDIVQPTPGSSLRENIALRVMIRTVEPLGPNESDALRSSLEESMDLRAANGDVLTFTTGALGQAVPVVASSTANAADFAPAASLAEAGSWNTTRDFASFPLPYWILVLLVVVAIGFAVLLPRRRLARDEIENFADLLRSSASERRETV